MTAPIDVAAPAVDLRDTPKLAAEQEAAGAAGVWTAETTRSIGPILAATAHSTQHCVVGAGVYVAPLHHPLALAQELLDLAEMSDGRFVAGVGLRSPDLLRHQTAQRIDDPVGYMQDYLRALRAAMSGARTGRCNYRGREVTVRYPPVAPISRAEPPPVVLAAVGAQMVRLATQEADGWILHPIHTTADTECAWSQAPVAEVRARRPFLIVSYRLVWCSDWPRRLLDGLRANLAFYALARRYHVHRRRVDLSPGQRAVVRRLLHSGAYAEAGQHVSEAVAQEIILCGTAEEIRRRIAEESELVDRVCLTLPWIGYTSAEYAHALSLLTQLLPHLRSTSEPVGCDETDTA